MPDYMGHGSWPGAHFGVVLDAREVETSIFPVVIPIQNSMDLVDFGSFSR